MRTTVFSFHLNQYCCSIENEELAKQNLAILKQEQQYPRNLLSKFMVLTNALGARDWMNELFSRLVSSQSELIEEALCWDYLKFGYLHVDAAIQLFKDEGKLLKPCAFADICVETENFRLSIEGQETPWLNSYRGASKDSKYLVYSTTQAKQLVGQNNQVFLDQQLEELLPLASDTTNYVVVDHDSTHDMVKIGFQDIVTQTTMHDAKIFRRGFFSKKPR